MSNDVMAPAPVDAAYAQVDEADKVEVAEAFTHPALTHPQQPSFPRPYGLDDEGFAALAEGGVLKAYHGVASELKKFGHAIVEELEGDAETDVETVEGQAAADAAIVEAQAKQAAADAEAAAKAAQAAAGAGSQGSPTPPPTTVAAPGAAATGGADTASL